MPSSFFSTMREWERHSKSMFRVVLGTASWHGASVQGRKIINLSLIGWMLAAAFGSVFAQVGRAQEELALPERGAPRNGPTLRQREMKPNLVVTPPPLPGTAPSEKSPWDRLRWKTFTPDTASVETPMPKMEPPKSDSNLPKIRVAPALPAEEFLRGVILLPGNTALELAGTDLEAFKSAAPSPASEVSSGQPSASDGRWEAIVKRLDEYAAGVQVAPGFEGMRDHGTRPPPEVIKSLNAMKGSHLGQGATRKIAEAIVLGFAMAGQSIFDVVVIPDSTAPGIFKAIVFRD